MIEPRYTVAFGALKHDAALRLSEEIEKDLRFDALAISINETDERANLWEVIAYFASRDECEALHKSLGLSAMMIAKVPDADWVRQSLAGLSPVMAGRFYLYGSHDRNVRRAGGISLEVDAGTAFGTGHHATTAGCLLALDGILKKCQPRRILDVGCGTGVLAIAAVRATRQSAIASDIDPEAVAVTRANAKINHVAPMLKTVLAAGLDHRLLRTQSPFDLVFANILARPLARLAHGLSRCLSSGGRLILSGLTIDQVQWISACYRNDGLVLERRIILGNWATLVMVRPALWRKSPQIDPPVAGQLTVSCKKN